MLVKRILTILLTAFCIQTHASASTPHFFQSWNTITYHHKAHNSKFQYLGAIQLRLGNKKDLFERSVLQLAGGYNTTKNLSLWLGFQLHTIFNTKEDQFFNEKRLWQQASWKIHQNITGRTRLEERFSARSSKTALRLRQRLRYIFSNLTSLNAKPYIEDEVLVNLNNPSWIGSSFFNQNRAAIGLIKSLSQNNKFSISYMNVFSRGKSTNSLTHVLVMGVTFK